MLFPARQSFSQRTLFAGSASAMYAACAQRQINFFFRLTDRSAVGNTGHHALA
jgi:hypothetical protein